MMECPTGPKSADEQRGTVSPERAASAGEGRRLDRRTFLAKCLTSTPVLLGILPVDVDAAVEEGEDAAETPRYGMAVDIDKCIGCGRCVRACKEENDVPREPFFFRTWVERYEVRRDGVEVDSPDGGIDGFPRRAADTEQTLRSFFVPKLCNHCDNAPCVQVCPVGATFVSEEGVVLVDSDYCIGCRYCIQACPYGARFLHPETRTAEKCTFCYHRIQQGLQPACVEVCPTQARIFGDINQRASPLARFFRFNKVQVLKAHLNTEPKVFYAGVDGSVG